MSAQSKCGLCGEPMPEGEEMFLYHGYSGPCPVKPRSDVPEQRALARLPAEQAAGGTGDAHIRNEVRKLLASLGVDFVGSMAGAHGAVDALNAYRGWLAAPPSEPGMCDVASCQNRALPGDIVCANHHVVPTSGRAAPPSESHPDPASRRMVASLWSRSAAADFLTECERHVPASELPEYRGAVEALVYGPSEPLAGTRDVEVPLAQLWRGPGGDEVIASLADHDRMSYRCAMVDADYEWVGPLVLRAASAPPETDGAVPLSEWKQVLAVANEMVMEFQFPGHPGRACLQSGWVEVGTVKRWREVLARAARPSPGARTPTGGDQ